MKRIVFLVSMCLIAFAQCSKDEPISELISQLEEEYENLGKVETSWKEGDEKIETLWEEGCGKELYEDFFVVDATTPKMRALSFNIWSVDVAVIRLGPNCGDYAHVLFHMDCEDSNPTTQIKDYNWNNNTYGSNSITWLTNYGIQINGSKDLTYNFCLLPYYNSDFPGNAVHHGGPWGLIVLHELGLYNHNGYHFVRYFDNEDKNNGNKSKLHRFGITYEMATKASNGSPTTPFFYGLNRDPGNSNFQFASFSGGGTNDPSTLSHKFKDWGFPYAVFSKYPVITGHPVIEIFSDDEDSSNINAWINPYNNTTERNNQDRSFVKGGTNTYLYATRVKY